MKIAILYSRIRAEEKLIVQAFEQRGITPDMIDVRRTVFDLHEQNRWTSYDAVLERCVSHSRAVAALQILGALGVPCVNSAQVAQICGSKLETSLALINAGVPTPAVKIIREYSQACHQPISPPHINKISGIRRYTTISLIHWRVDAA